VVEAGLFHSGRHGGKVCDGAGMQHQRPGEQSMGLFLESEHFVVKPFSLDGLLDRAEEIGRMGAERSGGVLPQMPGQVQPGFQDDQQGERNER
jgi:hypothetical protein